MPSIAGFAGPPGELLAYLICDEHSIKPEQAVSAAPGW
jgi:hypothetical protein